MSGTTIVIICLIAGCGGLALVYFLLKTDEPSWPNRRNRTLKTALPAAIVVVWCAAFSGSAHAGDWFKPAPDPHLGAVGFGDVFAALGEHIRPFPDWTDLRAMQAGYGQNTYSGPKGGFGPGGFGTGLTGAAYGAAAHATGFASNSKGTYDAPWGVCQDCHRQNPIPFHPGVPSWPFPFRPPSSIMNNPGISGFTPGEGHDSDGALSNPGGSLAASLG